MAAVVARLQPPRRGRTLGRQLRARALRGGSGAHAADATLDAALELFRVAERMPKGTDTTLFIDALVRQRVPAVRSADAAAIGDGVHLMTAHRAKGGQWPVVVLAGLQQDRWPDSRGPVSLLGADRIGPEGCSRRAPGGNCSMMSDVSPTLRPLGRSAAWCSPPWSRRPVTTPFWTVR